MSLQDGTIFTDKQQLGRGIKKKSDRDQKTNKDQKTNRDQKKKNLKTKGGEGRKEGRKEERKK
jgi:hypothetical protein